MSPGRATAIGFGAILLWALLALFTVKAAGVPPFQLSAMCFAIGGALGIGWISRSGQGFGVIAGLSPLVWAVGVGGLFGYHFFYFTALRLAPPAQTSLIAYLWPLLIVLFSGLLPGERLRMHHMAGASIAFVGAALVVAGPGAEFSRRFLPGYAAAAACALIWSGYSVLSRRLGATPTASVAFFCIATAGLSAIAHLALERTVWPGDAAGWSAVLALGVGPVGLRVLSLGRRLQARRHPASRNALLCRTADLDPRACRGR